MFYTYFDDIYLLLYFKCYKKNIVQLILFKKKNSNSLNYLFNNVNKIKTIFLENIDNVKLNENSINILCLPKYMNRLPSLS